MRVWRIIGRIGRYSLLIFLSFLLLLSAVLWYVTTDSFQQMVRRRLIASIEHATGGRVDVGSFHAIPLRFEVEVRDLTIHGRESAEERPLAHVDSMSAVLDLPSVLGARMAFRELVLTHPVVHIIYYPDGSTNQPMPSQPAGATFDQMFAISVSRLEVRQGELFIDQERVPFEFVSNEVEAYLDYSFLHRRYSGQISVGRAETQLAGYRPFSWAAKTEFSIARDEVQLRSLSAVSQYSRFQGDGTISDFRHPVLKGNYDLSLDLRQVATILRHPQTASGTLHVRGKAAWSHQTYSTAGEFGLQDAGWREQMFSTKDVSASGRYAIDPEKITLAQIHGKALKGTFTSELEVINWNVAQTIPHSTKRTVQRGAAVLKARDIALSELVANLGPRFEQLKSLHLAASLSTNTEVRWKDALENAEINSTVSVTRPAHVSAGQLPLSADTRFKYQGHPASLEITNLVASTPATQIRASGILATNNALRLTLASDNLGEWTPLFSAVFPKGLPIAVAGHASFNGNVAGKFDNPAFSGNLQLRNFDALQLQPSGEKKALHWDSLDADLRLSTNDLGLRNALFRRGDANVRIEGDIALNQWNAWPGSAIRVNGQIENAEAGDVQAVFAQDLAATGKVSGHAELNGTMSKPQGNVSVTWTKGSIHGYNFDALRTSTSLANDRANVQTLEISRGPSRVSGRGWYEFSTRGFAGEIAGSNFDVSEFAPLERSRVQLAGTVDFSAKASGTLEKPEVSAHVHIRSLAFNGEAAGEYFLDATTRGPDLHMIGHSQFTQSELIIEGNVRLREQWPARIDFHFNHLDIDSFLESYLRGHVTGHSAVAGDLVLSGPLRDPRRLSLTGNLTDVYAEVEKVKIRNDGAIRFRVDAQTLNVDSLHLIGENTDLSWTGSMQLTGEQQLNAKGTGKVGLELVRTYDPDLTGSGTIAGQVAVTGTLKAPVVRGTLQVQNAAIADINLPSALSDLNGTLQFSQNQITIDKLSGRTGGGTVSFSGRAQLNGRQINFDLKADADSVRLRYPPGVSSTASASLHWSGSSTGSLLSGDIIVNKLGVTPGFDFGAYLARSVQSSSLPQTDPVLNNIRLDLHVATTPDLQMQTSVLRLRGEADLRVRGNAAKPVLLGRADVFEGEAYFNGTKYRLERGGITFGTPTSNNAAASIPVVDLEATTHVRDYDITLSVTGPADRPKMNYRSEPPLPTNDIIGLLAFGQTTEESAALQQSSQSAFSQQASNAMLAAALNATLNNRTQRLFGNSRIKIDPQGLETETSPTQSAPAVTIEQQVKDNLTLTYTTNVAQTSQQIIRAEYYVSKNVSIVAIRDQNGVVSFDVRIRRRKR